jgi:hypothetical protein
MDLAVLLPLAFCFLLQALISVALMLPRTVSRHCARMLAATRGSVLGTVVWTLAAAIAAMTAAAGVQLAFVLQNLHDLQRSDR